MMFDRVLNMAKVLNISLVLNMPGFCLWQGSEYTRVLNMPQVLNMSGLYSVFNMPEYA